MNLTLKVAFNVRNVNATRGDKCIKPIKDEM
jgi:hypothetical protein